jgi:hypothetical protein
MTQTDTRTTATITMITAKTGPSFTVEIKGYQPATVPDLLAAVTAFIAQNRLAPDSDLD